jgi:4a-hydroxytetrahydrobiopterin dehydratase
MKKDLLKQKCVPCEGGVKPLNKMEAEAMLSFHIKDWTLDKDIKNISKIFKFKDFKEALSFVDKVGALAEKEGHHPDILLFNYKEVKINLSTHAIGGLSQNDFILAVKINELLNL